MNLKYKFRHYLDATTHSAVGSNLRLWIKMIFRHIKHINWRFLPRVLFITIIILIYTPFRLYERLFFNRKVRKQVVKPPVFILGHYRSGTTFLHYLLGRDTNMAYASTLEVINPNSFLGSSQLSLFITKIVLPNNRPMDNLKMSPSLPFEEEFAVANMGDASLCHGYFFPKKIKAYFADNVLFRNDKQFKTWKKNFYFFLQKLTYKHQGKTLLLKTPANTARLRHLLEMFPNAKFIHIHRNPYKVYLSNEGLYEGILPILAFHTAKNEDIESFILDSYKATYEQFLEDKKLLKPGQLTEVAYEHFVKSPIEHIRQMYYELGLDGVEQAIPSMIKTLGEYKNYQLNSYQINEALRQKIYQHWKFAFDAFGYDKSAEIISAPTIHEMQV